MVRRHIKATADMILKASLASASHYVGKAIYISVHINYYPHRPNRKWTLGLELDLINKSV